MITKLLEQIAERPDMTILWGSLMLSVVVGIALVVKWQLANNKFDLKDLICLDGKISETRLARFGAFAVSTWCFIYLTATGKLTEWFFMGYMAAWVGNALFNSYLAEGTPSKGKSKKQPADSSDPQ